MDILKQSALTWKELTEYRYQFIYGYKKTLYPITLTFSNEDYPHLAGFQYMKDITSGAAYAPSFLRAVSSPCRKIFLLQGRHPLPAPFFPPFIFRSSSLTDGFPALGTVVK